MYNVHVMTEAEVNGMIVGILWFLLGVGILWGALVLAEKYQNRKNKKK